MTKYRMVRIIQLGCGAGRSAPFRSQASIPKLKRKLDINVPVIAAELSCMKGVDFSCV
jgi:hypothetical protein